jgi:hypothetical protein
LELKSRKIPEGKLLDVIFVIDASANNVYARNVFQLDTVLMDASLYIFDRVGTSKTTDSSNPTLISIDDEITGCDRRVPVIVTPRTEDERVLIPELVIAP